MPCKACREAKARRALTLELRKEVECRRQEQTNSELFLITSETHNRQHLYHYYDTKDVPSHNHLF